MDRNGKGRGRGGNFLRFIACGVFFYDITFKSLRYFTCNILTCFSLSSLFYFTFITGRLQWSIIFCYILQYLLIIIYNLFLSFSFLFSISSHSLLLHKLYQILSLLSLPSVSHTIFKCLSNAVIFPWIIPLTPLLCLVNTWTVNWWAWHS